MFCSKLQYSGDLPRQFNEQMVKKSYTNDGKSIIISILKQFVSLTILTQFTALGYFSGKRRIKYNIHLHDQVKQARSYTA